MSCSESLAGALSGRHKVTTCPLGWQSHHFWHIRKSHWKQKEKATQRHAEGSALWSQLVGADGRHLEMKLEPKDVLSALKALKSREVT